MNQKTTIKTGVLLVCLMFTLSISLFPIVLSNGGRRGYSEISDLSFSMSNESIEGLIVSGAGFLLEGNGRISQILMNFELQDSNGITNDTLSSLIEVALVNIQEARYTYERLIRKTERTPYDEKALNALRKFDYQDFCIKESLNSVIFGEVESYLMNGDITGSFKRMHGTMITIEGLLINLKTEIYSNRSAAISTAWKLNETSAQLLVFGSYLARVFAAF